MQILIVQSDGALATFLRKSLEAEGYWAAVVDEKSLILPSLVESRSQLVILDTDNLLDAATGSTLADLVSHIRNASSGAALLVISSQSSVEQRVAALDAGADDFVAKPFSYFELAARIRVLLRRGQASDDVTLQIGELRLDRFARTVSRAGRNVELTAREFRLLEFLMRNYGQQVSREAILDHVWSDTQSPKSSSASEHASAIPQSGDGLAESAAIRRGLHSMTNIVDVYVNYLRQKLGDTREKRLIHTVRGVGYQLGSDGAAALVPDAPTAQHVRAC